MLRHGQYLRLPSIHLDRHGAAKGCRGPLRVRRLIHGNDADLLENYPAAQAPAIFAGQKDVNIISWRDEPGNAGDGIDPDRNRAHTVGKVHRQAR